MFFSGKMKEHLVTALEVPRDLAYRETIVTITGPNSVLIENYRSIGRISKEEITVICIHGRIELTGERMEVVHYNAYEMLVTGRVKEIHIQR